MLIKIINNDNAYLEIDPYGNMYLEHNNKTYQVNINGNNVPYLEGGNYIKIEHDKKPHQFNESNNNKLNNHIKIEELDGGEDLIKYFPEDIEYYDDMDNNYDEMYEDDNLKFYGKQNLEFNIWTNTLETLNYRKGGEVTALYDTYIYDKTGLILKSKSKDDNSIYRFKIYLNGNIYFRIIGDNETKYNIYKDDNDNIKLK